MGQCASLYRQLSSPVSPACSELGAFPNSHEIQIIQLYWFGLAGFVFGASGAVAVHELAHTAVAWALSLYPSTASAVAAAVGILRWALANAASLPAYLLAGASSSATTTAAAPFVSLPLPSNLPPTHWRVAAARHSGWLASALLAALACRLATTTCPLAAPHSGTPLPPPPAAAAAAYGAAAASLVVMLGALASDLLGLQPMTTLAATVASRRAGVYGKLGRTSVRGGDGDGGRLAATVCFFCGNIGLLVAAAAGSAVDMMSVLRSQVAISSQRGAQSGGLVTLVEVAPGEADVADVGGAVRRRAVIDGVRSRCAPGKRDHLSVELHRRFGRNLGRAPRLAGGHGIFAGHTRFATSSQPSEAESHPHQWSRPCETTVWRTHPTTGRLQAATERFGVWITHNGDFDFWRLMGQDRTHSDVAAFLNTALGSPSPAKCDSVRVAGMIELLRTQGLWFPSLRLAYYDTAASCSLADVVASADPTYTTKNGGGGDAESRSGRVATRAELLALAAAVESAFALLAADMQRYDAAAPTTSAPFVNGHDEDVITATGGAGGTTSDPVRSGGGAAAAAAGNGSLHGNGSGTGVVSISVHGGAHGGGGGGIEFSNEGTVHGVGGIGAGRPSVVPMPYETDLQPTVAAVGAGDDADGTAEFLRERRPSFDGLLGAASGADGTGDERALAGAVLAAVQRTAMEHHGLSAYDGSVGGSVYGGAAVHATYHGSSAYAALAASEQHASNQGPANLIGGSLHGARGRSGQVSMDGPPSSSTSRAGNWTSVRRGALDVRRRSGAVPAVASTYTVHPLPSNDLAAAAAAAPNASGVNGSNSGRARYGAAGRAGVAVTQDIKTRGGGAAAAAAAKEATATAVPEPQGVFSSAADTAATATGGAAAAAAAPSTAAAAPAAGGAGAAAGGGGGGGGAAAAAAAAARQHGAVPDIPVSYGQEAVNMACALGWARGQGARSALVSALVDVARRHLESSPGWPAWRATVPSLERLICTALSYFVANDLYTASCRFLKHAKGSFGLAILCSLEPDRLCMGAWGQPMAMSFSQAHHAVLYGSETNCAMIPIASRSGVPPAGNREAATPAATMPAAAAAAAAVAGGGRRPPVAAETALSAVVSAGPSRRGNDASNHHLVQVRRIEERLTDTIQLNGSTVELIRDASRHDSSYRDPTTRLAAAGGASIHGAGGAATSYSAYLAAGGGGSSRHGNYSSAFAAAAASGGGGGGGGGAVAMGRLPSGGSGRGASRVGGGGGGAQAMSPLRGQPLGESTETAGGGRVVQMSPGGGGGAGGMGAEAENGVEVEADDDVEVVVENGWSPAFATHRIDIDEGSGEMMQLVLTDPTDPASALDTADGWCMFRVQSFVRLRVFQLRSGTEVDTREDFEAQERIVQLVNNPYVSFSPNLNLTPGRDYVADDLADVSRVMSLIRDTWTNPTSLNRQTAEDLFEMLDKLVKFSMTAAASSSERPGVDVLITGVESSLWIAEQWAGDLKLVFPQLSVQAVSANKIISVLGNARGRIPPTGSTFCRSSASFLADHHTLCIAVSQSGQTFPTIHASRILNQLLPGRVFALCGSIDTKTALALGQRLAAHSPFTRRVMTSCAGGRCAEPPSVVCVALHQTLSELLAFLVVRMRMTSVCASGRPLGMILTKDDMIDLRSVRDRFVDVTAPQLTGYDAAGRPLPSEHHNRLVQQGRKWALHVIESPTAWVLSLIHILATVVSGWPVVFGIVHGICMRAGASEELDLALSKVALAVDSVIYMFLPIIYAVVLRAIQRRPLWHRMGKRTIVVADVPYVHQIIETFVSKMYALAYGIASVEVHGANPVDHFVHRFTHRVVRGLLIALGRPDGRLYSQTKSESWVLLGLLQAKVITSWGHQPEVVSIGHNPYHPSVVDTHLQLPTNRPRLLVEALEHNTGAVDPNQLWASRRHMVTSKFPLHHKAHELLREMEDAAGGYTSSPPTYNTANGDSAAAAAASRPQPARVGGARASVQPAATNNGGGGVARPSRLPTAMSLGRRTVGLMSGACNAYTQLSGEAVLNTPAPELRTLLGPESKHLVGGHLLYGIFKKTELRKMWEKIAVVQQLASVLSTKKISESVAREAVAAVGSTLEDVLHKQTVMEQLLESRYLSLERLLAFMVMFHAMARRTADWWPLTFDIARSQSGLRVATTAAPVTASELEQSLAETLAGDVVEDSVRRGEAASRDRVRQILTSHVRRRVPPGGAGPREL